MALPTHITLLAALLIMLCSLSLVLSLFRWGAERSPRQRYKSSLLALLQRALPPNGLSLAKGHI